MAAKKNGQRLAGTSRKPGSKVSTRLTLAAKIMIFAAVFTGHFLTTSLNQKKMVTFFKKLLLSITICFSFMMANSQVPTLNGAITSNLTAPLYYVTGDIYISSGVSITISAGTTLEFQDGLMFTINGTLTAVGSSGSEITFTASNPGTGWFGIELTSTSSSTFTYCIIEYVIKNQQPCNSNFSSCGGVYQSSATASFTNCTFRDNEVCSGGGVYVVSSLAQIYDCTFHNNVAEEYGGAIYINNASQNSNIQLNTIENNTAEQGGGMYFTSCDYEIVVDQNDLNYNEAEYGAGAYFNEIDISGESPFADNTVYDNTASVDGGGLYFNSCIIQKIEDNTLELNEADDGGGIYVNESKINIMILNLLENNSADNDGGGIFLNESYIRFRLSKLIGNSASNNGGAICISGEYISGDPNFIVNSLLADNDAGSNSGGIYTDEQFISYSNTIADNSATNGGGIYNYLATPTVINTIIWGNTATNYNPQASPTPSGTNGYSYTCCRSITNCATCTTNDPNFVGSGNYALDRASSCYNTGYNSAYHESIDLDGNTRVFHNTIDIGAYEDPFKYICGQLSTETWTDHNPKGIDYKVYCDLVVPAGSTLTVNSGATIAFDDGLKMEVKGSIDVNGSSSEYVTFTAIDQDDGWGGLRFGNTTTSYNDNSELEYCHIQYVIKDLTPAPRTWDDPDYSGGVFIEGGQNCSILINHCKIHHNLVSAHGGGILCNNCSENVIIEYSDIYNNSTKIRGGGISLKESTSAKVRYNNIFSNNSNTGGAGIWIDAHNEDPTPSPPHIYHNNIYSNIDNGDYLNGGFANSGGGGIGLSYSNAIIDDNSIYNNESKYGTNTKSLTTIYLGFGGGIFLRNSEDAVIKNNNIYNNESKWGGGISIENSDATIFSNKVHENNVANEHGGGIFISSSSTPTIYNCLIANNEASGNGAGIYIDASSPKFYNCTIADNEADGDGDGVYFDASSSPKFTNTIIYHNNGDDVDEYGLDPVPSNHTRYVNCFIEDFGGDDDPNYDDDPRFVNHSTGDYRISCANGSLCIEAGDNTYYNSTLYALSSYDIRGSSYSRKFDGDNDATATIDIGAYEYEYSDCNGTPPYTYKLVPSDSVKSRIEDRVLIVYPNPAVTWFSVQLFSETEDIADLYLINSVGKVVMVKHDNLIEGQNYFQIKRNQLPAGIYFLQIKSPTLNIGTMKLIFK